MSNAALEELSPPGEVRLHHFGFVLSSIQDSAASFARSLGATWDGNIVFDPIQKVRVTFLEGAHAHNSLIELVEPGGADSPVSRFLERGKSDGSAFGILQVCRHHRYSSTSPRSGI